MRKFLIFLLLIAALGAGPIYAPVLLKNQIVTLIHTRLAALGYPDATFEVTRIAWNGLRLETVSLDKEGIDTIRAVDATYTPFSLLRGRVQTIVLDTPEIFFDAGTLPDIQVFASSSLKNIPVDSVSIPNFQLGYAGDENNLTVYGSANLATAPDGTKKFVFSMKGNQREISLVLNGILTETLTGERKFKIDLPEARLNVPQARLSRATGHATFTQSAPSAPFGIEGELIAGALKIGPLMLDGLSMAAKGEKPTLVMIGSAGVTGLPQTTMNLRIVETEKNAILDLRLSGDNPSGIATQLFESPSFPLPKRQSYSLSYALESPSLLQILAPSAVGTISLSLESPETILSAAVNCRGYFSSCTVTLPKTELTVPTLNGIFGPALAAYGILLNDGTLVAQGRIGPSEDEKGLATDGYQLGISTTNLDLEWGGLPLLNIASTLDISDRKGITFDTFTADSLGGTIEAVNLSMTDDGNGALGYLSFTNIDVSNFLKIFPVEGLKATGLLGGRIPLKIQKGNLFASDESNLIVSGGHLRYSPQKYPGFLEGDSSQRDVLRQTLTDYTFNELSIHFSGPLSGEVTGILEGTGRNTELFGQADVGLDIRMSGKIPRSLRKIIP